MLGRQGFVSIFRRALNEPSSSLFLTLKSGQKVKTASIINSFYYSSAKMYNQNPEAIQLDMNKIGLHLRPQVENDKGIYSMSGSTNANTQPEEKDGEQIKSNQNDDGGNNNKPKRAGSKKRLPRIPNFYGFLLRRVALTAQLYLDATPDEQGKVDENSRYYYVKQTIDNLKMKDRKSFREHLNSIKKEVYHKPRTEEELAEMKSKGIPRHTDKAKLSKKFVEEFLSGKHGQILIELNEEFVKPGNRDYELYMDNELDEVKIGKVVKRPKVNRKQTWNTMLKDMDHYKHMYAVLVEAVKVKQEILSREKDKGGNVEENTQQ